MTTTNLVNVLLHPLEQLPLVTQAVVHAHGRVLCDLLASKKAVGADAVVEVDDNHIAIASVDEVSSVVVCITVDAEAASLNKDVDGK